ncbi:MAG: ferritin-like domain-containing protein [Ktedonobacterales bacterium]
MHHDEKLQEKLVTYLEDAYAMEHQIEETLEHQVKATKMFPDIQAHIQEHLNATKQHKMRMEERLGAYNKKPSGMKDLLSRMTGNMAGVMGGSRPDSLAMTARDDYMIEHLEIGSYELLIATAQAFGDTATVQACEANLRDEVLMANWLESQLGQTAILSLQQDGLTIPLEQMQAAQSAVTSALRSAHVMLPQMPEDGSQPPMHVAGTI